MTNDKFIVSSIKDSKKISKVLSNDTSRDILDILAEKSMTAAQLSSKMKLPLTTVDYSLKNLESVGLVKTRTGFNENKRIAKYYEPQEKYIVLAPGKNTNILPILKTLLPVFLLVIIASAMLEGFVKVPVYTNEKATSSSISDSRSVGAPSSGEITQIPNSQQEIVYANPHYGLMFGSGALAILFLYAIMKTLRKFS